MTKRDHQQEIWQFFLIPFSEVGFPMELNQTIFRHADGKSLCLHFSRQSLAVSPMIANLKVAEGECSLDIFNVIILWLYLEVGQD